MTFLEAINLLISKGAGALPDLSGVLEKIEAAAPDVLPADWREKLNAVVPPDGETLVGELQKFVATRSLDPRQHPSDLAG